MKPSRLVILIALAVNILAQSPPSIPGGGIPSSGPGSGTVTNIATGCGLTGGPATSTATFSATGPCYATGGGTAQAQTATYSPAITLAAGQWACWLPSAANTGSGATFAPNGLTAHAIVKAGGAALAANDIITTAIACAVYDATGTQWELQNPQAAIPYVSLVQSAGGDCVFALHTDTITGMTCANTSVDGTTETAFQNGVTIPANSLASNEISIDSAFLVKGSASAPTLTLSLRLGGIGGTQIWKTSTTAASNNENTVVGIRCMITALDAASATTHLVVSCTQANLSNAVVSNSLLSNTTQSITADVTSSQTLVWTVQYGAATASNAIGLYSMFNGIR